MDIALILRLLEQGLVLWNHESAQKYKEKLYKLRKEWHEEYKKVPHDNNKMDTIQHDIEQLCNSFLIDANGKKEI